RVMDDDRDGLRVRLLGPVSAERGGRPLDCGTPRQRAVLAVLASRPGQVGDREELVAAVWGGDAPAGALKALHTYVYRLRTALEPDRRPREGGLLARAGRGYVLLLPPDQVDACVFADLVERARAETAGGDTAGAVATLTEA